MAGGSKVVQYIIEAKDATARGVESAKRRIRELFSKREPVPADAGKGWAEKLKENIVGQFSSATARMDTLMSRLFSKFGVNWGKVSGQAEDAIAKMVANFTGLGSAGAKALTGLGAGFAALGGLAVAAVSAWKAAITKACDYYVEKWKFAAQLAADNVRAAADSMGEYFSRVFQRIDDGIAALRRKQANRDKLAGAANGLDDSGRLAAREREVAEMLAAGASTDAVAAKREEYRREDELVKLKQEELDIERQLRQIKERREQRKANAAEISDAVVAEADRALRTSMDNIAKGNKRLASTDSWWSTSSREERIAEEVNKMTEAEQKRIAEVKKGYEEVRRRRAEAAAEEENDTALEKSLEMQRQGLAARREAVTLSHANADALKNAAEAEEAAKRAAEETAKAEAKAARDAEQAAREAERRAAEDERAARELASLSIDLERARHAVEIDGGDEVAQRRLDAIQRYYDALASAQDEAERAQIRADYSIQQKQLGYLAELEREREQIAQKAYQRDVQLAQQAVSESVKAQSAAQSRLAVARSKVSQAWGWYRNTDSMQAHIDDVLEQRQAEKQFEKDFKRLQFRHSNWRDIDIGKLSASEEATRQVALAKEEEAAAQKALDEIAENTRDLAEKLDELLTMKEA